MASNFAISHAAHIIRQGGIIAYATDTIYGLGCDPFNTEAVERINIIKQRPANKHFILLAGDITQLNDLIDIDKHQQKKILQTTEPTSWIVPASAHAPYWLVDENNMLTIRITAQQDVVCLCHALGHAIISTSANPTSIKPAVNALQLHQYFHDSIDKMLTARKPMQGKPSKIIRLCDNHVIRE